MKNFLNSRNALLIIFFVLCGTVAFTSANFFSKEEIMPKDENAESEGATESAEAAIFFTTDFASNWVLQEASSMAQSTSPSWWLNSGGIFYSENGKGKTLQGDLSLQNRWYGVYKLANARDTDNGRHPQNLFRLVTKGKFQNLQQTVYFRIIKDNLSASEYRNGSNGVLLFNRYENDDNLYYAGLRVDGYAVIKKKIDGKYFTMAYTRVYPGVYSRDISPNLLPHNVWLGLRSEVQNNADGSVNIRLFVDKTNTGNWQLVTEAKDDAKQYGGRALVSTGHGGIRTDFMDLWFDNYRMEEKSF